MTTRKTAMGKTIDMAAMQAQNERVRAVSNASVNARGDTIDSTGNIISAVSTRVNEQYVSTVGNRDAQPRRTTTTRPLQPDVVLPGLTLSEQEINEDNEADAAVEQIKAAEVTKSKAKK